MRNNIINHNYEGIFHSVVEKKKNENTNEENNTEQHIKYK